MAVSVASPRGEVVAPKASAKKSNLKAGIMLTILSVILCLAAVEFACFKWEQATAQGPLGWTLVAARRLDLQRHGAQDHPYYLFRPNSDYNWTGIPVHIGSRGFRTQEFDVPKSAGTVRILNLGDSVAFGWNVRQEETYGKQLEDILNARNDGHRYEVLNTGVPGWNTPDERNFLLQEALSYQPDVVLLDITLVNDIYGGEAEAAASQQPTMANWLRDHTYFWPMITVQGRVLLSRDKGPEAIPVLNPPRDPAAYYPLSEDDPHWDRWWSAVADMRDALQKNNIPLVLVPFPTAFQFSSAQHPDVPQRVLAKRAAQSGIQLLDLLPIYRDACQAAGPDACEGFWNLLSVDVWMHPTPLGHRLAAEALAQKLTPELP